MNVYEKLQIVQSKLIAPKDLYNDFGKYSYRSAESILEALKPHLVEVKAVLTLNDEILQLDSRFYIKATATFLDIEKGEKIEVSALAREDETKKGMDLAQVTGSVSSYARKYALNGLFCIDDTKDSDATNTHGKDKKGNDKPTGKSPQITEGQVKRLYAIANKKGYDSNSVKATVKKHHNCEPNEMNKQQYDAIVAGYEKLPDK